MSDRARVGSRERADTHAGRRDGGSAEPRNRLAVLAAAWGRLRGADQPQPTGPVQLQQVVDRAVKAPLGSGRGFAAQEQLSR